MYRRRNELLDDVFAQIEAALPGTAGQKELPAQPQLACSQ